MRLDLEVTEDTTIKEIREAVLKHYRDNPDHGSGCACLDSITGPARAAFHKGKDPLYYTKGEAVRNGWFAVDYVIYMMKGR